MTHNGNGNGVLRLPHSKEMEDALMGAVLIDPDLMLDGLGSFNPGDFYQLGYGPMFAALKEMVRRGVNYDVATVIEALRRKGVLDDIGGEVAIGELIGATPSSVHAGHYRRIVERDAIARRLVDAAAKLARLGHNDKLPAVELAARARRIVDGATDYGGDDETLVKAEEAVGEFFDRLERIGNTPGGLVGLPTPWVDLNRLLGGLQQSDLIILAGRPGMGKSAIALQIATCAARKYAANVALFSLEMARRQLVERAVSSDSGVNLARVRVGDIPEDSRQDLIRAGTAFSELPLWIDDSAGLTPDGLRRRCLRQAAHEGIDLVIVDYIQLMRVPGLGENERTAAVSAISRSLKELARELNVPVLALSQLNRACESRVDKRPMLSDLKQSGSIEQDADVVLFIYRDEVYDPNTEFANIAEILCRKHRNGPTGDISLYFKKSLASFVDLSVRTEAMVDWVK